MAVNDLIFGNSFIYENIAYCGNCCYQFGICNDANGNAVVKFIYFRLTIDAPVARLRLCERRGALPHRHHYVLRSASFEPNDLAEVNDFVNVLTPTLRSKKFSGPFHSEPCRALSPCVTDALSNLRGVGSRRARPENAQVYFDVANAKLTSNYASNKIISIASCSSSNESNDFASQPSTSTQANVSGNTFDDLPNQIIATDANELACVPSEFGQFDPYDLVLYVGSESNDSNYENNSVIDDQVEWSERLNEIVQRNDESTPIIYPSVASDVTNTVEDDEINAIFGILMHNTPVENENLLNDVQEIINAENDNALVNDDENHVDDLFGLTDFDPIEEANDVDTNLLDLINDPEYDVFRSSLFNSLD